MVQQAQVALPSFGACTYECYQNERRIPSCEAGTRYPLPSVWGVLRDGGFFACSSLSMKCAGSLGFDAANKLVGPNAQNLVCDDVNKKNRPIGIP
ncbi:MAG: hypothetical protein ING84_14725 [Cytophagales bacterium]|nr:hypothetical protein [Cytophagales bacterium]